MQLIKYEFHSKEGSFHSRGQVSQTVFDPKFSRHILFLKYRRALLVWFLNKILNFKRGFVVIEKLALIIGFSYGFDSLQERKFKKAKISFF